MSKKNISVEELKHEIFEKDNAIEGLITKLDKAMLILGDLSDEYNFIESPSPIAAVRYGSSLQGEPEHNKHGKQSFKWICDYNRIHTFINIALDYVYESYKELDNLMEKKLLESQEKTA